MGELGINVMKNQVYMAKKKALKLLEGDPEAQYIAMWHYADMHIERIKTLG